jgi:ubiquinone/menaquinone biosynthesis C-methylase UbiE
VRIGAIPENLLERIAVAANLAPTPVVDTLHAVIVARAVVVATRLGIFDALKAAPLPAKDIASRLGLDPAALEKLANLLVSIKYLRFRAGAYGLTPLTRKWLVRDSGQSLYDSMMLRLLEWQAIERTEDFVRTGKSLDVHDLIEGDQWDTYQRGMRALARLSSGEVASRVRLPANANAMLDIGGGHGSYSAAFCRRHSALRSTILDLPEAVAIAAPILAEEKDVAARIEHRAGNALTDDLGVGRFDLVFISHLVHHFTAPANEALIRRAARALRPGGTLAILDVLRPGSPATVNQTGALLDLYFAITSNSGTWSMEEINRWFAEAGLEPAKPIALRTAPGVTVLAARKAATP